MTVALLTWAVSGALATPPSSISVTYTTKFDLPAMADQVCGATGVCDCTVTYRGEGALVEQVGDRLTFKGTWKLTDGRCHDAFLLWAPADGAAYHTIRLSADGGTLTEWIGHQKASATERLTSNIKAGGQVWLAGMQAPIDPEHHVANHLEKATGDAGGIGITSEHRLTVVFVP